MKVDRTKLTAEYENGVIKSVWVSVEVALDSGMGESAFDALDLSKNISDEWCKKNNLLQYVNPAQQAPIHELPTINRAEERLQELIEDAITREELEKYKDEAMKSDRLSKRWLEKCRNLNSINK